MRCMTFVILHVDARTILNQHFHTVHFDEPAVGYNLRRAHPNAVIKKADDSHAPRSAVHGSATPLRVRCVQHVHYVRTTKGKEKSLMRDST